MNRVDIQRRRLLKWFEGLRFLGGTSKMLSSQKVQRFEERWVHERMIVFVVAFGGVGVRSGGRRRCSGDFFITRDVDK
ncbi:hypothetical protein Tco_1148811 [Tanacetum coccineum]